MTEASPFTHIMPNSKKPEGKVGSIGLLGPSMQCKVIDVSSRKEVFSNSVGELLLKGPNIMKGYYKKPNETKTAIEDGWYITGDFGYYDSDNYFYISDRIKELIKVKGLQVAPAELEAALLNIPGIIDCAVFGVSHEKYGEVPRAFVVKNKDIDEKTINEYIASHLSDHKQLRGGIKFINEIPKTPSGKILRRLLKNS